MTKWKELGFLRGDLTLASKRKEKGWKLDILVYLCGKMILMFVLKKYKVLFNSEALILLTEWKEFRSPDFTEIKSHHHVLK